MITELEVLSRMHEPVPHAASPHHLTVQNNHHIIQNSIVHWKQLTVTYSFFYFSLDYN